MRQRLPWDPEPVQSPPSGYIRERSDDLYHTSRWTRLARQWKVAHPLCARCQEHGVIKAAEHVDHKVPWPICQDFFDTSNLQSLCAECNMLKGIEDRPKIQQYKQQHQR